MEAEALELVSIVKSALETGGDAAVVALALILWRLDRRLLLVEVSIKRLLSTCPIHRMGECKHDQE